MERALHAARQELVEDGDVERPTWDDSFVAMADRCLGASAASRPNRDRHLMIVHLRGDDDGRPHAHLHAAPPLPGSLRRLLGCEGRVRPLFEVCGVALSVGRAQRIVAERTRWLQVHHVTHWEDGGATDTANLLALCSKHHRLHHLGKLGITGDADDPRRSGVH